jgi:hypothetical protein
MSKVGRKEVATLEEEKNVDNSLCRWGNVDAMRGGYPVVIIAEDTEQEAF